MISCFIALTFSQTYENLFQNVKFRVLLAEFDNPIPIKDKLSRIFSQFLNEKAYERISIPIDVMIENISFRSLNSDVTQVLDYVENCINDDHKYFLNTLSSFPQFGDNIPTLIILNKSDAKIHDENTHNCALLSGYTTICTHVFDSFKQNIPKIFNLSWNFVEKVLFPPILSNKLPKQDEIRVLIRSYGPDINQSIIKNGVNSLLSSIYGFQLDFETHNIFDHPGILTIASSKEKSDLIGILHNENQRNKKYDQIICVFNGTSPTVSHDSGIALVFSNNPNLRILSTLADILGIHSFKSFEYSGSHPFEPNGCEPIIPSVIKDSIQRSLSVYLCDEAISLKDSLQKDMHNINQSNLGEYGLTLFNSTYHIMRETRIHNDSSIDLYKKCRNFYSDLLMLKEQIEFMKNGIDFISYCCPEIVQIKSRHGNGVFIMIVFGFLSIPISWIIVKTIHIRNRKKRVHIPLALVGR